MNGTRIRELRSITTLGTVNHERDTDPWSDGDPLKRPFKVTPEGLQPSIDRQER